MEYDPGDSFPFKSKPNGFPCGLNRKRNCHHDHIPFKITTQRTAVRETGFVQHHRDLIKYPETLPRTSRQYGTERCHTSLHHAESVCKSLSRKYVSRCVIFLRSREYHKYRVFVPSAHNPFLPTVAFSQQSSNICCPRD